MRQYEHIGDRKTKTKKSRSELSRYLQFPSPRKMEMVRARS